MRSSVLSLLFSLFLSTQMVSAQTEKAFSLAPVLGLGTKANDPLIGIHGQLLFNENVGAEIGFNYYFPESHRYYKISNWALNFNLNYYFKTGESVIKPYVLTGVNLAFWEVKSVNYSNQFHRDELDPPDIPSGNSDYNGRHLSGPGHLEPPEPPGFDNGRSFDSESTKKSKSYLGLNIGSGIDLDLDKSFVPFTQVKFVISDVDQFVVMMGIRFYIGG